MGTETGQDSGISEEVDPDIKIAELIGVLLYNLSSSEIRRQVLYKASILEANGSFEKRKKDPKYKPQDDKNLADQLLGKTEQLVLAFVPEGKQINVQRTRG